MFDNFILISNSVISGTLVSVWSLPSAGFSNPGYLGAPASQIADITGFDITTGQSLSIAFEGTYTGQVVSHEQTLDNTGAAGWFSVQGAAGSGAGGPTSTGSTTATEYVFPVLGVRHRIKVTALSTGTLQARVGLSSAPIAMATTSGGGGGGGGGGTSVPLGYQQIVGLVAATALTVPAGATYAVIVTESQSVRWRDDGVDPTAAVGEPLLTGQSLIYNGTPMTAIKFIQTAATATLNISYYR